MKKTISIIISFTILISSILSISIISNAASQELKAGQVKTSGGNLNIRSKNSNTSPIKSTLANGKYITLISKSGSWWYIEYAKGKYGYCHSDYVKIVASTNATVNINSGSLNVRSGAGTSYKIKSKLSKGDKVLILSDKNSWSKILFHGNQIGYVSNSYLYKGGDKYKKVSLNIPNYKQTDSRWSNVKIGTSGKTIGQIGCVTTAIAMIESYRNNKKIYPDAMSKKLSYSSTGNVYWPNDYISVTESKNYLNGIYKKLTNSKPILFGAKKSNGQQHWVVITGFKGSNTVSAENFLINDPGSNSRTNLKQLLDAYPIFYKYFYY